MKNGDVLLMTRYVKITSVCPDVIQTDDLDGLGPLRISGKDLLDRLVSADEYYETEDVTKTRAAEILIHAGAKPFTVVFEKSNGDERTLRGRLIAPEPLLGRSKVEDLDVGKDRVRLVDHRTIKSIVLGGVKYTVKS